MADAGQTVTKDGAVSNASGGTMGAGFIALTKVGAGTLALNNANSTFSGGLIINAGTVTAGGNNVMGTGMVTMNGGTFN